MFQTMEMNSTPSVFSDNTPGTPQQFRHSPFFFPKPSIPTRRSTSSLSKLAMYTRQESARADQFGSSPARINQSDAGQDFADFSDTSRRDSDENKHFQDHSSNTKNLPHMDKFRHHPDSVLHQPENRKQHGVQIVQKNITVNGDICGKSDFLSDKKVSEASKKHSAGRASEHKNYQDKSYSMLGKVIPKYKSNSSQNVSSAIVPSTFTTAPIKTAQYDSRISKSTESLDIDKSVQASRCTINLADKTSQARSCSSSNISKLSSQTGSSVVGIKTLSAIHSDKTVQSPVRHVIQPGTVTYTTNVTKPTVKYESLGMDPESRLLARQRILQNVRGRQSETGSPKAVTKTSSV